MTNHYIETDLRKSIKRMGMGDKFTTKSRTITKSEIEIFVLLGGDYAPQFLSEKGAKEYGLRTQLVPGLCALNIAYGLLIQAGFLGDVIAYMATTNMQFLLPIYAEDSIKMETVVTAKEKSTKGLVCEYDWAILNQDDVVVSKGHNI